MKVFDEFGHTWRVQGGHPAARHVNKLKRSRYELVVLPLATLATGRPVQPYVQPEDPIRAVRLAECLEVISSGT